MEKSISKYWGRKRSSSQSWHSGNQYDYLPARTPTWIWLFNVFSIPLKFLRAFRPMSAHIRYNINKKEDYGKIKITKAFVKQKVKRKWERSFRN